MNILPGWQNVPTIENRSGSPVRAFVAAVVNTTAGTSKTFAFTLPDTGLKRFIVGLISTDVASALTATLGAGAGTPLTRLGEHIQQGGRRLEVFECWTDLSGAQNLVVTYSASLGTGVATAYVLRNLKSIVPFSRVEAKAADVTAIQLSIDIPEDGVLLGFYGVGDAAPGIVSWNTPGEDSDATSTTTGWSSHSTQNLPAEQQRLVRVANTVTITDNTLLALTYR